MITKILSSAPVALQAQVVECEVEFSRGEPRIQIVGLADIAVKEAKQRVMSAIRNSSLDFPYSKKIVINLAPANVHKEGSYFDLAIALGILLHKIDNLKINLNNKLFIGELSLDGKLRAVNSLVPILLSAKELGFKEVYFPKENFPEAQVVKGLDLYPISNLREIYLHLLGQKVLQPVIIDRIDLNGRVNNLESFDFKYIKGQNLVRRALEISAAGGHNVRMYGPPGSGKTFMAHALVSILPDLSEEEIVELTKIYSVANILPENGIVNFRPFRSPHHSSSLVSLVGGGRYPRPGEITLAHRGVLFLDELAEFPRYILESLRQPLEDGEVSISRANGNVKFPANFTLVTAENPCPCGYYGDPYHECTCSTYEIEKYQKKISGPLLDRIDLHVPVEAVPFKNLLKEELSESSYNVKQRVLSAREIQYKRFKNQKNVLVNADMSNRDIIKYCNISNADENLLLKMLTDLKLSARSYFKVLKVARTIADLDNSGNIKRKHLLEALQYKQV